MTGFQKFLLLAILSRCVFTSSAQIALKILGGNQAGRKDFPFMVSLRYSGSKRKAGEHFCGGVLVSRNVVLTAAHCVCAGGRLDRPERRTAADCMNSVDAARDIPLVNIGRFYRTRKNDLWIPPFEERSTIQTIIHPDFEKTETDELINDIALLVLDKDSFVDPVELRSDECHEDGSCEKATVAGWGRTVEGSRSSLAESLMKVEVPVFSQSECRSLLNDTKITEAMVCAGEEGKDSCQMDSGGPLLTGELGALSVLGVVSFGKGCGRAGKPGVYASVPKLKTWIDGQLEELSPPIVGPKPEPPPFLLVPPPQPEPEPEPEPKKPEPKIEPQSRNFNTGPVARCYIFHGFWVPPGCNELRRKAQAQQRSDENDKSDTAEEEKDNASQEQKEVELMSPRGPDEGANDEKNDPAEEPTTEPESAQPSAEPAKEQSAVPKSVEPTVEPAEEPSAEPNSAEPTEELKPTADPDESGTIWDVEDHSDSDGSSFVNPKAEEGGSTDEDGQDEATTSDKDKASEQTPVPAVLVEEVVSRGRLTRQSSTAWGGESSRAVDGNFASDFSKGSCTHTGVSDSINGQFSDNPWWSVDLGATRQVTRIRITNRADCCDFRLTGFEIRVGDLRPDGNGRQNSLCREMLSVPRGATSEFACVGKGRFLSIRIPHKSKILTLCEVEVIAKREPVMNVDEFVLSRGQPTFQSSTKWGGVSSRAVDGSWNTDFDLKHAPSCTHTGDVNSQYTDDPWWAVDLGLQRKVVRVRITNRSDCCADRLSNFEVRVGSDRPNGDGSQNSVCAVAESVVGGETIELECARDGRFLSIRIPGKERILTLCEVEVIGTGVL